MTVPRRPDLPTSSVPRGGRRPRRPELSGRRVLLGAALLLGALAAPGAATARAQPGAAGFPLIPYPAHLEPGAGEWRPGARLVVAFRDPADPELRALGELAAGLLGRGFGVPATVASEAGRGDVVLALTPADSAAGPESYRLEVTPRGVALTAPTGAGLFYGLQTLRQLLPLPADAGDGAGARRAGIPAVRIADAPRFAYRGLHLDVARHFFPVGFVKRYIDLMARYKLNTFHWHLTDDQGWRIEIQRYPRLTEVGACRRETMVAQHFDPYVGDGTPYCGHYTQAEIRDVVAYARARHVTIVPEIEMPGHAMAALAAYPELACTPGPFEVSTMWGVREDIFCPSEATFTFLENVLTEVMELFPGRYVHVGGDEAPKVRWEASPLAQAVIRREGLADEHELQSYFIQRIGRFLAAHGRRLIGWDEILEGGLAPDATVMSWRGTNGGIAAATQGHDVVMTPTSHLYFDYYQGDPRFEPLANGGVLPLDVVYGFEPVPDSLPATAVPHIIGAQANLWSEYLTTPAAVEYMTYPRALALAEVVWSPREARSWEGFSRRLPARLRELDALGVGYRIPSVEGLETDRLTLADSAVVTLGVPLDRARIRYTLDGSDPDARAPLYTGPLTLRLAGGPVTVTARAELPGGRTSAPRAATFSRTTLREPAAVSPTELTPGLRSAYYEAQLSTTAALDTLTPVREGVAAEVGLTGAERPENFGLRLTGYLSVPRDGIYTFTLGSDDGSTLAIGDRVVVDHDGFHGDESRSGMVALRAGLHPVTVRYFQGGGGKALRLTYRLEGGEAGPVPAGWLFHQR